MWENLLTNLGEGLYRFDPVTIITVFMCGFYMWGIAEGVRQSVLFLSGKKKWGGDPLDKAIMGWNRKDMYTLRDFTNGGLFAIGRTGSGKTSSLKMLAMNLLAYGNTSILVMCAKKGEADDWVEMCAKTGRSQNVIRFGIHEFARFNMLSYEANREGEGAGQTANIVRFIMNMQRAIFRRPEGTGNDSEFWQKQTERAIMHAVNVLHLAGYEITSQAIQDVILEAPTVPNYKSSPAWRNNACNKVLDAAKENAGTRFVEAHDCKMARNYFLTEWQSMAQQTRGSILVGIMSTLTPMNTGIARELFATKSTTNPKEQIEGRAVVLIDYPPAEFGDLSKIANLGIKQLWQQEILRREVTADSPIAVIWGDEAACWVSAESDSEYLSRCRSGRGSMVYIAHSLASLKEVLPGEKGNAAISCLLGNFSHRLVFALSCSETANWASELCGKELQQLGGGGTQFGEMDFFNFRAKEQYSASFSEQWQPIIQPGEFMNGFRTGGRENGLVVDALLIRSGAKFSNGLPIIRVAFKQE